MFSGVPHPPPDPPVETSLEFGRVEYFMTHILCHTHKHLKIHTCAHTHTHTHTHTYTYIHSDKYMAKHLLLMSSTCVLGLIWILFCAHLSAWLAFICVSDHE